MTTELGGGPFRLANYRAECNPFAAAAWSGVVPWPEKDGGPHSKRLTLVNNYYDTTRARRLRLTRPVAAHAPVDCAASTATGHNVISVASTSTATTTPRVHDEGLHGPARATTGATIHDSTRMRRQLGATNMEPGSMS
jgi:hypothetical protein